MKLLHTSDWHIGRSLFEFSLLDDQREIFEQICSIVRSEQVDAVLISGDLYDRSLPSADAVQLLDHIFTTLTEQIGVPVLAISGNHDSGSRVSYGSRMLEKSGLYLAGGFSPRLKKVTLHFRSACSRSGPSATCGSSPAAATSCATRPLPATTMSLPS